MIEFTNLKRFESKDFGEYLKIKAYSNSFLKREQGGVSPEFIASDKVRLGSMVDEILTEAEIVDMTSKFYPIAKTIAIDISNTFGYDYWNFLESQVAFTVDMSSFGVTMPMKGRLDKFGIGRVFDLKITHLRGSQLKTLIKYMGYDNQMWLYSKGLKCTEPAVLVFYSVPDRKVYYEFIDVSSDENQFFSDKLLLFGK